MCDMHRMLRVMIAWWVICYQSWTSQSLSVVQRPLVKWFLDVWMDRLAAFILWFIGSTNCYLYPSFLRYSLMGVVAWLSLTLKVGLRPFSFSSVNT